ncbi:MAG: hypothetical protein BIFFINMI_00574 [Phycisphaerae bacterium]|nr:hypothetical protein [Phycisphaerae bacterium]
MKLLLASILAGLMLCSVPTARGTDFVREDNYDTTVHPDDAAVNVSLVSDRWPDCTTLESTMASIFRIEGVADREKASDQDRALALWKWFRIMVSATGGGYVYEGPGLDRLCYDPHKILTVYGHHQCDGMSWTMVPLWRAAGYMALDECHNGHTIAALRYKDADGLVRYHNLDPQGRYYYWDADHNRLGTWTIPIFTGHVHRHVLTPLNVHSLRTSLRIGETVGREWANTGNVIAPNKKGQIPVLSSYYEYNSEKPNKGVYASAGQEIQTLVVADDLHPAEKGKPAEFVYRLPPPFVVVEGSITAKATTADPGDVCRIQISRDGGPWQTVFEKSKPGAEDVSVQIGRSARADGKPDAFTAYEVRVRVQLQSVGAPGTVAVGGLKLNAIRELNKRTLPNLMPGQNVFRVNADKLPVGYLLKVDLRYQREGKPVGVTRLVGSVPFYFAINEDFKLREIRNYDQDFNNETVAMAGYSLTLVPADGRKADESLPAAASEAMFAQSCPHPADMTDRKVRTGPQTESSIIQTNGFVPQSEGELKDDAAAMADLIKQIEAFKEPSFKQFVLIQQLGEHRGSLDYLLKLLPGANIDCTVYVVKGLARQGDARAIDPMLDKWNHGMRSVEKDPPGGSAGGAPGARYIPDALAAIIAHLRTTDTPDAEILAARDKIVAALLKPLPKLRFDFRLHIARALGILGGDAAEAALVDLAANDPFGPSREQAAQSLAQLRAANGK